MREGLENEPMLLYNNLYALLILLWSFADWDEKGENPNELVKNKINRALMQIVYNYKSLPTVRQALSAFPYQFYLPGKGFFKRYFRNRIRDARTSTRAFFHCSPGYWYCSWCMASATEICSSRSSATYMWS